MNFLENYKHNLLTGALAAGIGLATKKGFSTTTVGSGTLLGTLGAFVLVSGISVGADYALDVKKKLKHSVAPPEEMGYKN